MATQESRIASLVARIATEFKSIRTALAAKADTAYVDTAIAEATSASGPRDYGLITSSATATEDYGGLS